MYSRAITSALSTLSHGLRRGAHGSPAATAKPPVQTPQGTGSGMSDGLLFLGLEGQAWRGGPSPPPPKSVLHGTAERLAESNSTLRVSTEPGFKHKSLLLLQVLASTPNSSFLRKREILFSCTAPSPQQPSLPPQVSGFPC